MVFSRDKLTLAACAVCPGVVLGVFLTFPIWAPSWISDLGANRASVMLIFSASGILMTLTMPIVGRLLTHIPTWRMIVAGGVLLGGGMILASMLKSCLAFGTVYAIVVGVGVAMAGILPCQTLAARLFPNNVGAIGGLIMVALSVCGVAFPLLLTPLKAAIGWRTAFAGTGAFVLILIPLVAVAFMREQGAGTTAPTTVLHSGAPAVGDVPTTGEILRSGKFWILMACVLPLMAAPTAVQTNLVSILADQGIGQRDASFVLSGLAVGNTVGAVLFGWLADRTDPRLVLCGAAGLMAVSLLAFAFGGGGLVAASAAVLIGVPSGGISPLMSTLAFRQFRSGYAPALGLLNFFMLPYMFGPPLIGWMRDHTGSYSLSLFIATPIVLLGAACVLRLKTTPASPDNAMPQHAPAH